MEKKKAVTPEAFVRAWQTAETIEEVAKETGMTVQGVKARAYYYRKAPRSIPLKKFRAVRQPVNYVALRHLAESLKRK